MSGDGAAPTAAKRAASGAGRLVRVWRNLPHERRLAAYAAIGLFLALFLPWYQETVIASGKATHLQSASASITGWGAFSFVEAAVLLVAAGVLTLLFQRAEGRAFHLPGGDGWVIMAAGLWTCVLIVWRIFDKQGTSVHGPGATTSGIEWGIFVALGVALFLTYAGSRIRAAHQPEPPLPGEGSPPPPGAPADRTPGAPADRAPASPGPSPRHRARPPRPVPADPQPRRRRQSWEEPPAWEDHTTRPDAAYEPPPRRRPVASDVSRGEAATEETRPVAERGEDAPTLPLAEPSTQAEEARTLPLPQPSTQAGRGRSHEEDDEQLTIPLEPEQGQG